jgi:hypothetical protein
MNKAMKTSILKLGAASVALLLAGNVMADVIMSINDPNSGGPNSAFCEYAGLSASLGGNTIINGGEWIGIYSFAVQDSGGTSLSTPFYSTCISPNGRLYNGQYTYTPLSFRDASPGINPAGWTSSGSDYWGIQNANYLFQYYSDGIVTGKGVSNLGLSGSGADQGAALALAMYAALYNSRGYGQNWNPTAAFSLNGASAAVTTDYNAILSALQGWNPGPGNLANGYVLRPTDGSAQDMLLLGGLIPQGHLTPVPEPTTVIAGFGALGLLLFGAGVHSKRSVLRIGK